MKKFRNIITLILALALILCLPLSVQAQEEEYREIYLEGAYRVNDTQIIFDFSEPIKINYDIRTPWVDIRMTSTSGSIVGIYDNAGNRTAYYQWYSLDYQYLNADHDKIIFTISGEWFGCDGISDFYNGNNTFPDDVKEKIEKGTYRFYLGIEEKYPAGNKELTSDGQLRNLVSETDSDVFVWPTRLSGNECVHYWLDELQPVPANIKVDPNLFEPMSGKGQDWDFNILSIGTVSKTELAAKEAGAPVVTVVKNNPVVMAAMIAAAVLVPAAILTVTLLITKKRKAA